jgi:hypothetical protein
MTEIRMNELRFTAAAFRQKQNHSVVSLFYRVLYCMKGESTYDGP